MTQIDPSAAPAQPEVPAAPSPSEDQPPLPKIVPMPPAKAALAGPIPPEYVGGVNEVARFFEQGATTVAPFGGSDGNSDGLGFQRVGHIHGSTYRDSSTIIIVPERKDMFHRRVVQSWQNLIAPMNQKRCFLFVTGDEVGVAYTNTIRAILADPQLSQWKYVLTLESDNLPPPDAHIRLIESIEALNFDVMAGIYFTKGDVNMPMAYGDPEEYRRTGVLDFRPRDIRAALSGGQIVEVNGVAMGCTLYKMDVFRSSEPPWFVTVADVVEGKGAMGFTQDLYACQQWRKAGKRLGVDTRVRVGHLDIGTGVVY